MPLAILTLVLAVAFAVAPIFIPPFNGYDGDQLPIPQPDPPIQPEGYAFAIWTVIYLWLIASAAYGLRNRAGAPDWARLRPALFVTLAIGTPWTAIANASAVWATIAILIMLGGALFALFASPDRDRWWLRGPVALLAGWLTAASWVSLSVTLAGHGVAFDMPGWSHVGLIGALATALAVQWRMAAAPEYGLAVVWALVGIAVANGSGLWTMTGLALAGAVAVAAVALRGWLLSRA